jgi:hypothetical protein
MRYSNQFALKSLSVLAFGAIALLGSINPAQAFSFKVTSGIAGPNGELNQGAFSEFSNLAGTTTVDFNNGQLPTSGLAQYSFSNGAPQSSIRKDMWAPTGAKGEKNDSKYLAVFQGNNAIINLQKNLNYFGIDWGAAHSGNTYSFYKGDSLLKSFSTTDIEAAGGFDSYSSLHPGSGLGSEGGKQGNGYVHFYADSEADIFDRIVISQVGGGGFETDNHSFHMGDSRFTGFDPEKVPEPAMMLGLVGVAGALVSKRKQAA